MRTFFQLTLLILLLILPVIPADASTVTVQLQSGFNFISCPLSPQPALTSRMLFESNQTLEQCFQFDSAQQSFSFQLRLPAGNLFGENLTITNGMGLVLRCTASTTISFTGEEKSGFATASLTDGFNFIGFPPLTQSPTAHGLLNTQTHLQSIFRWDPMQQSFGFSLLLPDRSIFGSDFTLDHTTGFFFRSSGGGSVDFGELLFTGIVTSSGAVELPASFAITPTDLNVLTAEDEQALDGTAGFTVNTQDTSSAPRIAMVTDNSGNPVFIGYELPGTSFTPTSLSASPIRRAAGTGIVINSRTTALAICMINPLLLSTSNEQKRLVAEAIFTLPGFAELVTLIEQESASYPSDYLDVDKRDGGIYDKALLLTRDALATLGGNASPAPPVRSLERGVLFGVDREVVNGLTGKLPVANWKTTQVVAHLYRKTTTGWEFLPDETAVVAPIGGFLDKIYRVKINLWPPKKWFEEFFAAAEAKTTDLQGQNVDLRLGAWRLVLFDTYYEEPDGTDYYHAALLNSIDFSFMFVSLFLDVKNFSPSNDSQVKQLLKLTVFNDAAIKNLLNIVRTKWQSLAGNVRQANWSGAIEDLLSILVDGDSIGIAIKFGLGRAASAAREKLLAAGTKIILKSVLKKIGPGLVATGYDAAALLVFAADWVRKPNKREYFLLDGFVYQEEKVLDHLSLWPESRITVLPGQTFHLGSVGVVLHFTDGEMQGVKTGYSWQQTAGGGSLNFPVFTAPALDGTNSVFTVTYALDDRTRSTQLTVHTDGQSIAYLQELQPVRPRLELRPGATIDISIADIRALYSDGRIYELDEGRDVILTLIDLNDGSLSGTEFTGGMQAGVSALRATYTDNGITRNCWLDLAVLPPPELTGVKLTPIRLPLDNSGAELTTPVLDINDLPLLALTANGPARPLATLSRSWKIISGPGTIWSDGYDHYYRSTEAGDTVLELSYTGRDDFSGLSGTTAVQITSRPRLSRYWAGATGNALRVGESRTILSPDAADRYFTYLKIGTSVANPLLTLTSTTDLKSDFETLTWHDATATRITNATQRGQIVVQGNTLQTVKGGYISLEFRLRQDFGLHGVQETIQPFELFIYPALFPQRLDYTTNTTEIRAQRVGSGENLNMLLQPHLFWQEDPDSPLQNPGLSWNFLQNDLQWTVLSGPGEIQGKYFYPLDAGTPDNTASVVVQARLDTFGVTLRTPPQAIPILPTITAVRARTAEITLLPGQSIDTYKIDILLSQSHGFPDEVTHTTWEFLTDPVGSFTGYGQYYTPPATTVFNYVYLRTKTIYQAGNLYATLKINLPGPGVTEGGTLTFLENPLRIRNGTRTNLKFIQVYYQGSDGLKKLVGGANENVTFNTDYLRWENWTQINPVSGDGLYWSYDLNNGHADILEIAPVSPVTQPGKDAAIQSTATGTDNLTVTFIENGVIARGTLEIQFY